MIMLYPFVRATDEPVAGIAALADVRCFSLGRTGRYPSRRTCNRTKQVYFPVPADMVVERP